MAQGGYSIDRAIRAIEIVASSPVTATELAEALTIHKRTARRILHRLEYDGYVTKGPSRRDRFEPTARLRVLGLRLAGLSQLERLGQDPVTLGKPAPY